MDRDASGAGLSFSEYADSAGIAWQPEQYVLTKNTFFSTIADPLDMLATITDSAPISPFYVAPVLFFLLTFVTIRPHVSVGNYS